MPDAVQDSQTSRVGPAPTIGALVEDDCFRILLATDNHIGYNEKDPIRGQDSINTFREILELAREHEVDFILLAGDLFHENKPSRACIHQTIALLREYTLGDRPVAMELLSDPMAGKTPGFHFPPINYEDPNLNVAIPCFSIHGNHDDPQGTGPEGALCALDILSVAGVVNYFGKVHLASDEKAADDPNADGMTINPILLQKGETRLAMYGIGNIKDTRMHYELRSNRVRMFLPEDDGGPDWFNILLVHQNRVKHGPQSSVPEGMFDDRVDLVVWGHEHDCRIEPEAVARKEYYITQPGSSVATSLAHGEAIPKKVGLLRIQGKNFELQPLPLKTVRPFKMEDVVLADEAESDENELDLDKRDTITSFLAKKVEELIKSAEAEWSELHADDGEKMMLPLIRLRVETTGANDPGNAVRFGQQFIGRIANPKDVLQYHKKKLGAKKGNNVQADAPEFDADDDGDMLMDATGASEGISKVKMNELVSNYLKAQTLEVLVENAMEEAVVRYVDKEDTEAIKDFIEATLKAYGQELSADGQAGRFDDENTLIEALHRSKETHAQQFEEHGLPAKRSKGKGRAVRDDPDSDDSMVSNEPARRSNIQSDDESETSTTTRGGRGVQKKKPTTTTTTSTNRGGKKVNAPSGKVTGKGKKTQPLFEEDSSSSSEELEFVPRAERGKKSNDIGKPKEAPIKKKTGGGGRVGQSKLSFGPGIGRSQNATTSKSVLIDISDDSE